MIVHIAEAYLDYEKSCVLGVYTMVDSARERIYAINEDRERWGFNRYAISSWVTGETLSSRKLWLYPAGGTLIEEDDWRQPTMTPVPCGRRMRAPRVREPTSAVTCPPRAPTPTD